MSQFRYRAALFGLALALALVATGAQAPAALQMVIGTRVVVPNAPVSECSTKAKAALNSVLLNAFEAGDNTGQWLAYGPLDSSGHASATAAIHCYPLTDTSYVATFTCSAQVPPNPETATSICAKLTAAFGGGKAAAAMPAATKAGAAW
ncbi:MAG: hypothetical protein JO199_12150 [Candidatus Eremiobacteraeota bacterium]|nr:hypothetical protein [Candidatus Eremiobacteraeota bacterium]